jgi:hypothetical protein
VPEEGRLGEDLHVEEPGDRLERDHRQLLEPVQPARGMNVDHRDGEEELPGDPPEPARHPPRPGPRTPADDVIAMIDRGQERFEVGGRPGLLGGRDEHERERGPVQPLLERVVGAVVGDPDDHALGTPAEVADQSLERPGHHGRLHRVAVAEHDDPDPGVRQGVAAEMGLEGVERLVVGRGHSASRRHLRVG